LGRKSLKNGQFSPLVFGMPHPEGRWQITVLPPGKKVRSVRVSEQKEEKKKRFFITGRRGPGWRRRQLQQPENPSKFQMFPGTH
jgi:hypothetical protein